MSEQRPLPDNVTPLHREAGQEDPGTREVIESGAAAATVEEGTTGVPVAFADPPPAAAALPVAAADVRTLSERLHFLTTRTLPIAWYRLTRVGPAGIIGATATLAALIVATVAVVSGRNSTAALMTQLAQAQGQPSAAAASHAGITNVVASFPSRDQIPAVVGIVYEQARAANVALDTGHYTYSAPKAGSVGRYELEFPVKADYPSVRSFIDKTLSAVPAAGLDKLRIERKAVGDPTVSANIRFVVFVRAEP